MRGVDWLPADDGNYMIPGHIPANENYGCREFLINMQQSALRQMVNIRNDAGNILDLVFTRNDAITSIHHAPVTLTNVKQTDSPHPPIEIALEIRYQLTLATLSR